MIELLSRFGADQLCSPPSNQFFTFPTWYEYLPRIQDANGNCLPKITALTDVWLIVAAGIDILLHIAALLAIGIIIYGGIKFMTSQGEPDRVREARDTIFNALIGLAISVGATFIVSFVARGFH